MPKIRILNEMELRNLVKLDLPLIETIEQAFHALDTQPVIMPPILSMTIAEHHGEVDVKTAYVPGLASFAIKMSPGFFDNPKLGLPSLNGLMVVFSATTGLVEALLLDNGYLTDLRTGAAGAVAAKHLARTDSMRATILGTGLQARRQLEALCMVRPIASANLWGRNPDRAAQAAAELTEALGIPVMAVASAEAAVRHADIIVTTTPSTSPILQAEWLQPGQHVTAMGSDNGHKNEISPQVLARANVYVCDRLSQARLLGELHHAIAAGIVAEDAEFPELGAVVSGRHSGRRSPEDITICDLTGTGVQDTAIASLATRRAAECGAGTEFQS